MIDPNWLLIEDQFDPEKNALNETLFALGNGRIGARGTFVEGVADGICSTEGTYLNGFYETKRIIYGEQFHGYPTEGQSMIQVMNGKRIDLSIDGESFQMGRSHISDYRRTLNMRHGVLQRSLVWQVGEKHLRIESERAILHAHSDVVLLRYSVTPLNFSGKATIRSWIDNQPRTFNASQMHDPRLGHGLGEQPLATINQVADGTRLFQEGRTKRSELTVLCGVAHETEGTVAKTAVSQQKNSICLDFTLSLTQNEPFILTKTIVYVDSRTVPQVELAGELTRGLETAVSLGYQTLMAEQAEYLERFWHVSDIRIDGAAQLQKGVRFNMMHLLQSTGRDGRTNIGAKGLTGEGYEGHYFWDTEIYMLSYFTFVRPDIARQLLIFRYHTLPEARERAAQMALTHGALYPWRTITGQELSAYFPAGTAQYHINADIAYAIQRYWHATQDASFMREYGIEMLVETARVWLQAGHFDADGNFRIDCVTGPDEYTALVNNNAYTNLMAANHLRFTLEILDWLREGNVAEYGRLQEKIGLGKEFEVETAVWQRAAAQMVIPYDKTLGVIGQDDTFLQKAVWDFENTPPEKYPLLLHYHPLIIYRYQVTKQADLLLAHFLLNNQYDQAQKQRDYAYYEPLTTHDSSLSMAVFGILAAEFGDVEKAIRYFGDSIVTDLADKKGNSKDGIHAANMAGSWMSIVFGFGGMRLDKRDGLSFDPICPPDWDGYQFQIWYRQRLVQLTVTPNEQTVQLLEGEPLTVWVGERPYSL